MRKLNRRLVWSIGFLQSLLIQTAGYGQPAYGTQQEEHIRLDCTHFRSALSRTFATESNLYYLAAGTAASLLALPIDESVDDHLAGNEDAQTDLGNLLGGPGVLSSASLLTFVAGRISDTPHLGNTGIYLIEALAVTYAATMALKFSVDRTRPNKAGNASFPSGHTSGSFAVAGVLHRRYGWETGVPAYLFAGSVGLARIRSSKHFLSDVLAGAAIGVLVGRSVALPRGSTARLDIRPALGWHQTGVSARLTF
jgi:hypothetical protein